ncbi:hypothetical protein ACEPPN_005855 [Leptodophora sp. 'Broadleaf-Isolate-01']
MEDEEELEEGEDGVPAGVYVEDPHKLASSLLTKFLEQQDAAADPYTREASNEEIDWDADPSALAPKMVSSSKRTAAMDVVEGEESEEDKEDEPIFGNVNLNAPEGESDDGEEDGGHGPRRHW